jgi:hypothetical protein
MEYSMHKFSRAASVTAGLALGLVTAGCASRQTQHGQDAGRRSALYDTSRSSDTSSPYGGTGMGGSGMDSGWGTDSAYRDTSTGLSPYPGIGGAGDTGMGTGGSIDTGMGGSGAYPGMDTLGIPRDSTRSIDSLGVPDWNERG